MVAARVNGNRMSPRSTDHQRPSEYYVIAMTSQSPAGRLAIATDPRPRRGLLSRLVAAAVFVYVSYSYECYYSALVIQWKRRSQALRRGAVHSVCLLLASRSDNERRLSIIHAAPLRLALRDGAAHRRPPCPASTLNAVIQPA